MGDAAHSMLPTLGTWRGLRILLRLSLMCLFELPGRIGVLLVKWICGRTEYALGKIGSCSSKIVHDGSRTFQAYAINLLVGFVG